MRRIRWILLFGFLVVVSCEPEKATPPVIPQASPRTEQKGCEALRSIRGIWREDSGAIIGICWDLYSDTPGETITVQIKKKNPEALYALEAGVYTVGRVTLEKNNLNNMIDLYDKSRLAEGEPSVVNAVLWYDLRDENTILVHQEGFTGWTRINPAEREKK
ncbi:MAG: hypothetical protein F9K24_06340 [Leptonema illini]|uniref:Lipoprotein n=1 Tax=Leptonema illini TaxID=183 RepID=A0A833H2J0_9LEPT|nr:MAG: hypothetical protein F9K24_06340 [Leptonema illini]